MKILSQMYPWTGKSVLNFGSNPDPESVFRVRIRIRTSDPDQILLGGGMRSLTDLVKVAIVSCIVCVYVCVSVMFSVLL